MLHASRRVIERVIVTYVEPMASVFQYDRDANNRSIVVCGGYIINGSPTASCEELPIDAKGLPAASSWRSFAPLPSALSEGCMLRVNGAVRVCLTSLFA